MRIQSIVQDYGVAFVQKYQARLKSPHYKALNAILNCRSTTSPLFKVQCDDCAKTQFVPHSCGNRHCPHCQQYEGQRWIEKQQQKKVPADYFLITFTLPRQLRSLLWWQQKIFYDLFFKCVWEVLVTFAKNDKQLGGIAGAMMVLHTHSRALVYHPHIHVIIPAATLNPKTRQWRQKPQKKKTKYLFNHKALAKVFRAKFLEKIVDRGFNLPKEIPAVWNVNCKFVGEGDKAIVYLGRYLYKGVIQEKDILSCQDGQVTFRYTENSGKVQLRTLLAEDFLWLILQHTLPKGFRRARDFGFLHPNCKTLHRLLAQLLNVIFKPFVAKERPGMKCPCCGGRLVILETRIQPLFRYRPPHSGVAVAGAL